MFDSHTADRIRKERKRRREQNAILYDIFVVQEMRKKRARARPKGKYGLSDDNRESMLTAQNQRCAICEKRFGPSKRPCVDHCHKTGRVRAFLCSNCNSGLGMFKDNVEFLTRAHAYLISHSAVKATKPAK